MKKALMVWGGWEGHQPRECTELFAAFLRSCSFQVEVCNHLECYADAARMRGLDLVVQCWSAGGALSEAQQAGLMAAVANGTGLAGWHGGLADAFRQSVEYQFMVGGQWVSHPGNHIDYRVRVTRPEDPLMAGIRDFSLHSEQYYLHTDPSNQVLAETTFSGDTLPWIEGTVMPVVWKRGWGRGRVFFASYGHDLKDFEVPEARRIVERGLLWAAREGES